MASDPIETVCGDILRARGHDLTTVEKTPKPAELLQVIGDYEGLIVRRCVVADGRAGSRVARTRSAGVRPIAPRNHTFHPTAAARR